ncbi:cupin domain-containing protein [soil metagenome]
MTEMAATLDALNAALPAQHYTPGWNKRTQSLWAEPRTAFRPRIWRFAESRAALERAGDLISTELAERRNLLMFDDADPAQYATTRTIVAAYQMLKPGEHARAHRHSPNALRLVLEGSPAVQSVVDGISLPMAELNVLLTPGWTWHSHFNNGTVNSYWIDFLDVPLVHQLEPMFFEPLPQEYQTVDDTPDDHPFLISADAIERMLAASAAAGGNRVVTLPAPSLRTMALSVIDFGPEAVPLHVQESSNSIFAVMRGEGSIYGDALTTWRFGDVFSLPMWNVATLCGQPGARLLRVSDEPAMRALGLFREADAMIS